MTSTYKVVLAYLKESKSISVDEDLVSSLVSIVSYSLDKIPDVIKSKGYDLKELISNLDENDENFLASFFSIFDDIFYSDPRRDKLDVDFHVSYRPEASGIKALHMRYHTIELVFGKDFLTELIRGWYNKNEKKKFISEFFTIIGHELVHAQQKGMYVFPKKLENLSENTLKEIEPYRPKLSEATKGIKEALINYIEKKGRKSFIDGFKKFYNALMRGKIKSVPPYLSSYYESIKSFLPSHLIKPALDRMAIKIDEKFYSKYTAYSEKKEWYSYLADPREIMAYAYSLVSKAHKLGFSKEKLIQALSYPEKYKEILYPLDFYQEFKKFEDDKNFSSREKKKIWQKFLKHVHGYIEQIYD